MDADPFLRKLGSCLSIGVRLSFGIRFIVRNKEENL